MPQRQLGATLRTLRCSPLRVAGVVNVAAKGWSVRVQASTRRSREPDGVSRRARFSAQRGCLYHTPRHVEARGHVALRSPELARHTQRIARFSCVAFMLRPALDACCMRARGLPTRARASSDNSRGDIVTIGLVNDVAPADIASLLGDGALHAGQARQRPHGRPFAGTPSTPGCAPAKPSSPRLHRRSRGSAFVANRSDSENTRQRAL